MTSASTWDYTAQYRFRYYFNFVTVAGHWNMTDAHGCTCTSGRFRCSRGLQYYLFLWEILNWKLLKSRVRRKIPHLVLANQELINVEYSRRRTVFPRGKEKKKGWGKGTAWILRLRTNSGVKSRRLWLTKSCRGPGKKPPDFVYWVSCFPPCKKTSWKKAGGDDLINFNQLRYQPIGKYVAISIFVNRCLEVLHGMHHNSRYTVFVHSVQGCTHISPLALIVWKPLLNVTKPWFDMVWREGYRGFDSMVEAVPRKLMGVHNRVVIPTRQSSYDNFLLVAKSQLRVKERCLFKYLVAP